METPDTFTLDDLIALYESDPTAFKPHFYVYTPAGGPNTPGESLGPIQNVETPVDIGGIYRGLAMRLGGPGRAVVRLLPARADVKSRTVGQEVTDAMWRLYGQQPGARPAAAAAAPAATQQSSLVEAAPAKDLVSVLLMGQQDTSKLLTTLLTTMMTAMLTNKGPDPLTAMLLEQNKTMLAEIKTLSQAPQTVEKSAIKEAMELGERLANGNNAWGALLAGPLDKIAGAIEKTVDKKADVALVEAQTKLMGKQIEAHNAGVPMVDEETAKAIEAQMKSAEQTAAAAAVQNGKAAAKEAPQA